MNHTGIKSCFLASNVKVGIIIKYKRKKISKLRKPVNVDGHCSSVRKNVAVFSLYRKTAT